jgi:hypothetical protein
MMNHFTVKQVTKRVKGYNRKLHSDSFVSFPNNLTKRKINCCGTVTPNHKRMPGNFHIRTMIMERSDIRVTTSGDMPVMVSKDKLDVHMLIHFHNPPAEGNFMLMTAK